jgi:hypothetical protein
MRIRKGDALSIVLFRNLNNGWKKELKKGFCDYSGFVKWAE